MIRTGLGVALAVAAFFTGCSISNQNESPDEIPTVEGSEWLRGDVDTRFALVAKHLRGFDMAMVEVGYRYTELYWASRDRNWAYATYQLDKIETAVANGVERRPLRAASARMLDGAVSQVRMAIEGRHPAALDTAITYLTATCNACHRDERVAFIQVVPPGVRSSPVRFDPSRPSAGEAQP